MFIALWVVNGLLAAVFLFAGASKLVKPKDDLVKMGMGYAEDFTGVQMKLIGAAEVLGALGLILPLLLGVVPVLTPIAAAGLALLMASAVGVHIRRKEMFVPPLVLGLLAAASAVLGFLVVLG
ncbi:MAG TPA: DoxX family protein [Terrimesophilobacter sp.]|nr:DoxX family protein [Terrimesophilobacter sp.]